MAAGRSLSPDDCRDTKLHPIRPPARPPRRMAAKAMALAAGDGSADRAWRDGAGASGRCMAGDATTAGGARHPDPKLARMRVLVVVPTYNEASGIETVLRRIREELPQSHVLVVDDNSPDGTAELVDAVGASDDHVTLLRRATK